MPILKTTVEISDELAESAKTCAAARGITLRNLFEQGLRMAISANSRPEKFELRDASVGGRGLQAPFRNAGWPAFREAIYEDRGG